MGITTNFATPFKVNSVETLSQLNPSTAALKDGGYVVTWDAIASNGSHDIYAQRYDAAGNAVGSQFLVNTTVLYEQTNPTVSALENGGFVIGWQTAKGEDTNIGTQVYASNGTKVGGQIQANTITPNYQEFAHIEGLSNGGFAEVWFTQKGTNFSGTNPSVSNLYAVELQLFSATGVKIGTEKTVISTTTVANQIDQPVAASIVANVVELSDGHLLVTWRQIGFINDPQPTDSVVYGQIYTSTGDKSGGLLTLANYQSTLNPHIQALSNGGFVLSSYDTKNTLFSIYDATGSKTSVADVIVGDHTQLNPSASNGNGGEASFTVKADGTLLFVYVGHDSNLYTQQFNSATGVALSDPVEIYNTNVSGALHNIDDLSIHLLADGGYTITFDANVSGGSSVSDIYAIQFTVDDQPISKIIGTSSNDNKDGTDANEILSGLAGNDTLNGFDGNDTLNGGTGDDSLSGGGGNDTYLIDSTKDKISELIGEGIDTALISIVTANGTFSLVDHLENATLQNTVVFSLTGNSLDNALIGNDAANTLIGGDGKDTLVGNAGNDSLSGGADNDSLSGGAGNDTLDGGLGEDTMSGGLGGDVYVVDNIKDQVIEDTAGTAGGVDLVKTTVDYVMSDNIENVTVSELLAEAGNSIVKVTGNALDNKIIGNSTDNNFIGGAGNDSLVGGAGNDTLSGGLGNNTVVGGVGDDLYIVDSVTDVLTEATNAGKDTVEASVTRTLGLNFENLTLTGVGNINGTGNALANAITGNSGNNVLDGGTDTLVDTLIGGAGDDTYVLGLSVMVTGKDATAKMLDTITELSNEGSDTLLLKGALVLTNATTIKLENTAGQANNVLINDLSNFENIDASGTGTTKLHLVGNAADNLLIGNAANNSISGADGNDTLNGGGGLDTLIGGTGNDTYIVDSITDIITETEDNGIDTVLASVTYSLVNTDGAGANGGNIENLTLTGKTAINGTGNDFANVLTGNDGANKLVGGLSDDTLIGGLGNDTLDGGEDNDSMVGGAGNDTYIVDSANDVVGELANGGVDTVLSSVSFDLSDTSNVVNDGDPSAANVENLTLVDVKDSDGKIVYDDIDATGNSLNNVLTGNSSKNLLDGGAGADTLIGGNGDDTYAVSIVQNAKGILSFEDIVIEKAGEGSDTIVLTSGSLAFQGTINVQLADNFENFNTAGTGTNKFNFVGNSLNNTIYGNAASNTQIDAGSGNDTIYGGDGSSVFLYGGLGNDSILGGKNSDIIEGSAGDDTLDGGEGTNVLSYFNTRLFSTKGVTVDLSITGLQDTGGAGKDIVKNFAQLYGSTFADKLAGDDKTNYINGLDGNDSLSGKGGDDTLEGGAGNDTLDGGTGLDTASYAGASKAVIVSLINTNNVAQDTKGAGLDTLINIENLDGSSFNDTLFGNEFANVLTGGQGADSLDGAAGDDSLNGGAGNDTLIGGLGNNTLNGGSGNDLIFSNAGDDSIDGGQFDFSTFTNGGIDTLSFFNATADVTVSLAITTQQDTGGAGKETISNIENLIGSSHNDTLTGSDSANTLDGADGNDSLNGGKGNDTLIGGAGNDSLDGGDGTDAVSYASATAGVTLNLGAAGQQDTQGAGLDTLSNIENVTGTDFNDTISGSDAANFISGGKGNDSLSGGLGNDALNGGIGNDTLDGGAGIDTISYIDATAGVKVSLAIVGAAQNTGGAGIDTLTSFENIVGSGFNDTLTGSTVDNQLDGGAGNDSLDGGLGSDTLLGGAGIDTLIGGLGNDSLVGADGNDRLDAGVGDDTLNGGLGNDALMGGDGNDTATYADASAAVSVNLALTTAQNTGGSGTDTLTSIENLIGSSSNDSLKGNALANKLEGGAGNDTLSSGDGNDTLVGGAGADALTGGTGGDVFVFRTTAESTFAAADTITDFVHLSDKMDLSAIDAVSTSANTIEHFTFVNAFGNHAGELRFDAATHFVLGDTNGDGIADFKIALGANVSTVDVNDFILS